MFFLHLLIKKIIHFALHVFWVFPVKKNRITLLNDMSYTYGDSMKYINEYIVKNCKNKYEIIFPVRDKNVAVGENCIAVKRNTARFFFYLLTSSVIITNAGGVSYLPLRKTQFAISTWHGGGPYKKTGNSFIKNKWYEEEMRMHKKNVRHILSSCKYFTDYEAKAMLFSEKDCVPCGMPRNDIFFQQEPSIREKVYEHYGLEKESRLVLFAPTFRTAQQDPYTKKLHVSTMDIPRAVNAIKNRFGGNSWNFGMRLHPKLSNADIAEKDVIDCTGYPDIQELLYSADILITDYSSLMWDFSLTGRPCFLYADDIDLYEKEHGFYMPSSQWPYPIARDNDEMEKNIVSFDKETYQAALKKHHEDCGSYEQGKACEQIFKLIENNKE